MNYYADRNYVHARIYGLHGLLLGAGDYRDIARSGNFQPILPGLDTGSIKNDISFVKERLFESQVSRVISLAGASTSTRLFFILFLRYFEIQNLRLLCAAAFGREPSPSMWFNIGSFAELRSPVIRGISGMDSVIECVRHTWMKNIFANGPAATFEEAEFIIDRALFRGAADYVHATGFAYRAESLKLAAGMAIYLRNAWESRMRNLYGMEPEAIAEYLESNVIHAETWALLKPHMYEWEVKLAKHLQVAGSRENEQLTERERAMERILVRESGRMFHRNFHSTSTLTCYLILLHRQIRNLFSIADGLRFGLAPEKIMENIICGE